MHRRLEIAWHAETRHNIDMLAILRYKLRRSNAHTSYWFQSAAQLPYTINIRYRHTFGTRETCVYVTRECFRRELISLPSQLYEGYSSKNNWSILFMSIFGVFFLPSSEVSSSWTFWIIRTCANLCLVCLSTIWYIHTAMDVLLTRNNSQWKNTYPIDIRDSDWLKVGKHILCHKTAIVVLPIQCPRYNTQLIYNLHVSHVARVSMLWHNLLNIPCAKRYPPQILGASVEWVSS